VKRADALRILGMAAGGAALSAIAWLHVGSLALLAAFPLGLASARRRREAFAFAFGYFGLNSAELPSILLRFFNGEGLAIAIIAPLALALILAAPFSLVGRGTPVKRALMMAAALLVITLPPVGFIGWLNPLFAAAALYPGTGVAGVALAAILFSGLAAWTVRTRKTAGAVLLGLLVPTVAINAWHVERQTHQPATLGVYALNTRLGKPSVDPEYRARAVEEIARRVEFHSAPGFDLVIFPESILHDFSDVDRVMLMPSTAQKDLPIVLFGATMLRDDHRLENGIFLLNEEFPMVASSRLPVPIGNWRPFMTGGVAARPFESDIIEIEGRAAAISVCYEDAVLWGHPGLMTGQSEILLSFANLWALRGTRTAHAQAVGAAGLARLGGVPLRRAVNE
jgi:hypothetical protein